MVISTPSVDRVGYFAVESILGSFKVFVIVEERGVLILADLEIQPAVNALESVALVICCISVSILGQWEVRPSELFLYCCIVAPEADILFQTSGLLVAVLEGLSGSPLGACRYPRASSLLSFRVFKGLVE
jgi:hypothetical protein